MRASAGQKNKEKKIKKDFMNSNFLQGKQKAR
jgi:hypothetical protein